MKIKEYIKKLNSYIIRSRVKDSSDILWERGADGVRAFLANQQPISGGGDIYDGYFKLIKNGMQLIIIDGYSIEEPICGYIYIDNFYPVNKTSVNVTGSGYVILKCDATTGTPVNTIIFDDAFDFSEDYEINVVKIPLYYVSVSDEETPVIQKIQQLQYGIPIVDLLKLPYLITDYSTANSALAIQDGVWKFVQIGECN